MDICTIVSSLTGNSATIELQAGSGEVFAEYIMGKHPEIESVKVDFIPNTRYKAPFSSTTYSRN